MAVDVIVTQFVQRGVDNLLGDFAAIAGRADTVEARLKKLSTIGTLVAGAGVGAAGGMLLFGKAALEAAGNMQRVEAGFTAMLGSPDAAKAMIADVQQFAARSPFDFMGSAKSAQFLLGMGVAANRVIPTLDAVGNAVANAGGGQAEFEGVLRAIGQIQTKGRLSQEELNQMAERGVNMKAVYAALQGQLGLTADQMRNIGAAGIDAEKALPVIIDALAKVGGGKGMSEQMKTLPGQLSMLTDAWNQFLTASAGPLIPGVTEAVKDVTDLVTKVGEFAKEHPNLVKVGEVFAGIAASALLIGGVAMKLKAFFDGLKGLTGGKGGAGGGGNVAVMNVRAGVVNISAGGLPGSGGTPGGGVPSVPGGAPTAAGDAAAARGFLSASALGAEGAAALGIGLGALAVTVLSVNDIMNSAKDMHLSDEDYAKKRGLRGELELGAAKKVSDFMGGVTGETARGAQLDRDLALTQQRTANRRVGRESERQAAPGYGEGGAGLGYYTGGNPAAPAVLARQQRAANARNKTTVTVSVDNPYTPADEDFDDRNSHSLYG